MAQKQYVLRGKQRKGLQDWEKEALHGQYLRQTKEVRSEQSWAWLHNRDSKRDTEGLMVEAMIGECFVFVFHLVM